MHGASKVVIPIALIPDGGTDYEAEAAIHSLRLFLSDWFLFQGWQLSFHPPLVYSVPQPLQHFTGAPGAPLLDAAAAVAQEHYGDALQGDHLTLLFVRGAGIRELGTYGWGRPGVCIVAWDALLGYADEQPGPYERAPRNLLRGAVAHELGHTLSFGHTPDLQDSVMWYWWNMPGLFLPRPVPGLRMLQVGELPEEVCPLPLP